MSKPAFWLCSGSIGRVICIIMRDFCFNPGVAQEYGVNEAIFIYNLDYWICHNKANRTNFRNGRYWTYNSMKAYAELFPFWTVRQIRHIIETLRDKGVILTDKFNEESRDQTLWYTLNYDLLQNWQMHLPNLANGNAKNGKCIIDDSNNIQDIYTNNKQTNESDGAAVLFSEPEIKVEKKRKTSEPLCLFANSRYNRYEDFAACFTSDEYSGIDIAFYYGAVADWSAQSAKKKNDWIATARNFMRSDIEKNKLHKLAETQVGPDDSWMRVMQRRMDLAK